MNCTAEINVVQARIQVLSAHLAGGPPRASGAVKVSDCAAPVFARPVAVRTQFARPAIHEGPTQVTQAKPLRAVEPRLSGPVYQPTKPGIYSSYAKRASATPRFARPCEKTEDVKPNVTQSFHNSIEPQVNIIESKTGYQMEVALPGMSASEVSLELQGTTLVITGRQAPSGKRLGSVRGFPSGMFKASSKLPNDIDASSVRADLVNGLLRIKARKQAVC